MRLVPRQRGSGWPQVGPNDPAHLFWMLGKAATGVEVNSASQV